MGTKIPFYKSQKGLPESKLHFDGLKALFFANKSPKELNDEVASETLFDLSRISLFKIHNCTFERIAVKYSMIKISDVSNI